MKYIPLILFLAFQCNSSSGDGRFSTSHSQEIESPGDQTVQIVGGSCEGCEAVLEFAPGTLDNVDTLPDFGEEGPKIRISGTIFQPGGTEPAAGVILYIYHTNQKGRYPRGKEGWARRHGYIRGWVKTGLDGQYTFYTLKPGTYPSRSDPSHVHAIVLEPNGKLYWIEDYLFDGDPLLSKERITSDRRRGGTNGVADLHRKDGILLAERDIELGKNIPGYE